MRLRHQRHHRSTRTRRERGGEAAMKIYRTTRHLFVEQNGQFHALNADFDDLVRSNDPWSLAEKSLSSAPVSAPDPSHILAPIGSQEVWAAGVTYFRSRSARM